LEAAVFLGVKVLSANSIDGMRNATIEALSVNEPVIINAVIDPEDYKWLYLSKGRYLLLVLGAGYSVKVT